VLTGLDGEVVGQNLRLARRVQQVVVGLLVPAGPARCVLVELPVAAGLGELVEVRAGLVRVEQGRVVAVEVAAQPVEIEAEVVEVDLGGRVARAAFIVPSPLVGIERAQLGSLV